MFVSTERRVDRDHAGQRGEARRPAAARRAWSSARRSTWWSSAYRPPRRRSRPGASRRRTLLVAPRLVDQLARAGQAGADRRAETLREVEPRGVEAARPSTSPDTRSRRRRSSAARRPGACAARASRGHAHAPLDLLERPDAARRHVRRLLDRHQPRARQVALAGRAQRARDGAAVNMPPSPSSGQSIAPEIAAGPPASALIGWAVRSRSTSSPPGRTCRRNAITLHIVPVGRNSAASWPSSSATRSCSALHGRVGAHLLVADLRARHRLAHPGRRLVCVSLNRG